MADMLAIVRRTVFEELAGDCVPGDVLAWERYTSDAPRLTQLTRGSRLFLVTVRPPDERLWLVAIYDGVRLRRGTWHAKTANTTPIIDITGLRSKLKFENGKGLIATHGLLANSLQTPRVLRDDDVALLERAVAEARAAGDDDDDASEGEDDQWFEAAELEPERLDRLYATEGLLTFVYGVGPTERDYDMRYEHARARLADLINAARDFGLDELKRFAFDVWIGQSCSFGHYRDEMFMTIAARSLLPADLLRRAAPTERLLRIEPGKHPVVDGAFPEVRIADGTIAGTWPPSPTSYLALSHLYRAAHGLAAATRDPYRQMALGAPEPFHFIWLSDRSRLGRRATEFVASDDLVADHVPAETDRDALIAFSATFDPLHGDMAVGAAHQVAESVFEALRDASDLGGFSADDLRTWLYFEGRKLRDRAEVDEGRVGVVIAELRRRSRRTPSSPDPDALPVGVPVAGAPWWPPISEFALTFNAYVYWGSLSRASTEADRVRQAWEKDQLPSSLLSLRTALFFEQRRWRHFGEAPTGEDLRYIAEVVGAIRHVAQRRSGPGGDETNAPKRGKRRRA